MFVLLLPVALPLWFLAILIKNLLVAVDFVSLRLWKFWSDPPKRRVGYYYSKSGGYESGKSSRMTLKRGSGERFFQH